MYKWNPKVKVGDYEFYKQYINKTNNLKRKIWTKNSKFFGIFYFYWGGALYFRVRVRHVFPDDAGILKELKN